MRGGTVTLRDVCRNEGAGARAGAVPLPRQPRRAAVGAGRPAGAAERRGAAARRRRRRVPHGLGRAAGRASGPERVYEHVEPARRGRRLARRAVGARAAGASTRSRACGSGSTPRSASLGIEPANCSVLGRAHDRAEGRLPMLAPGEERATWLEIQAELDVEGHFEPVAVGGVARLGQLERPPRLVEDQPPLDEQRAAALDARGASRRPPSPLPRRARRGRRSGRAPR